MTKRKKHNWLELTVLFIGLTLVCFTLGFLGYTAITARDTMPEIKISQGRTERVDGYYGILITAKNLGSQTVEDLLVEVVLDTGETEEVAQLRFRFLPGKSTAKGWATFKQDPSNLSIILYVHGYRIP
jgi:uncharacterized protein (TIGR02588 family)